MVWSTVKFVIRDERVTIVEFVFAAAEEQAMLEFLAGLQEAAISRRIKTVATRRDEPRSNEPLNLEQVTKPLEKILDEIQEIHSLSGGAMDF